MLRRILVTSVVAGSGSALSVAALEDSGLPEPVLILKLVAVLLLLITVVVLFANRKKVERHKSALFWIMAVTVAGSSFYLAGHTIYENAISVTKGPIHWHADYQVWVCGERLDLVDPTGLRNKIGSPLLHEHNDDRIHVEGTVLNLDEITLGEFFHVIGGDMTDTSIAYPANHGYFAFRNGDQCPQGLGFLKVYVNGKRVEDPDSYVLAPHIHVPPGDCIIIDYGPGNERTTTKICDSWAVQGMSYDSEVAHG